jgi:hypothetical protein
MLETLSLAEPPSRIVGVIPTLASVAFTLPDNQERHYWLFRRASMREGTPW